jgi:hypothetical protein
MIQYRDRQRQKAFIGAIIGAAASIAGGIIKGIISLSILCS